MAPYHGLTRERRPVLLVRGGLQSFHPPVGCECPRADALEKVAQRVDTECGRRGALASHPSAQRVLSRLVGESGANEKPSRVCLSRMCQLVGPSVLCICPHLEGGE